MPLPTWLADYSRSPEGREQTRRLGLARRTHGGSQPGDPTHPTYRSWQAMKRRCDAPKDKYWKRYGGRGISYDPRWASFDMFLADMGPRGDGLTLDRIDNDGNYEPGNCRWATASEQRRNHPHARGWKRPNAVRGVYGTKVITCMDEGCEETATLDSVVSRWRCPEHRKAARREDGRRWRAKRIAPHE